MNAANSSSRPSSEWKRSGTLAGAHDFNNLLTIVIGCGGVLQDRSPSQEGLELSWPPPNAQARGRGRATSWRSDVDIVMQVQSVDLNRVVVQVQAMLTGAMGAQIYLRLAASVAQREATPNRDPESVKQVDGFSRGDTRQGTGKSRTFPSYTSRLRHSRSKRPFENS